MKLLTLESDMPFGKFKGQQVEDLVEDQPDYLRWLCENTETGFAEEVLEALGRREARRT